MSISPPNANACRVHALVVCAGRGSRFGGDIPKQYLTIGGRTILQISLATLIRSSEFASLTLVVSPNDEWIKKLDLSMPYTLVNGGDERYQSVANGVQAIAKTASPNDLILIHDAVRPCLSPNDLTKVIAVAKTEPNGAIVGVPVADTLKMVKNGQITSTQDRTALWHAQTPQVFRLDKLLQVIDFIQKNNTLITDESQGFEQLGLSVAMVQGSPSNVKLTHPSDLPLITAILTAQNQLLPMDNQ